MDGWMDARGPCGIFANQSINCVIRQIVRNYGARNNLKSMKRGDLAFFYHRFVCPRSPAIIKMRNKKKNITLYSTIYLFLFFPRRKPEFLGLKLFIITATAKNRE